MSTRPSAVLQATAAKISSDCSLKRVNVTLIPKVVGAILLLESRQRTAAKMLCDSLLVRANAISTWQIDTDTPPFIMLHWEDTRISPSYSSKQEIAILTLQIVLGIPP